jgi:Tfp pilus assembly protein PilF
MIHRCMAIKIACISLIFIVFLGCKSSQREAEQSYQEGIRSKEHGEFYQAMQQFRSAITLNPQHINAYIEIGGLLCQEKQYAEAIKYLLRAVEYGATSYKPYAYMGYAYEQLGSLSFAERYYKQAIIRSPKLIDVRLHLADILETQEKRHEASDALDEVLALKPDIENEAVIRARISLLRQPQSPDVHRALADVYIYSGNIQKGFAEYRKFDRLEPGNPQMLANFGIFCAEREQFTTAEAYLKKAIELGVTNQPEVRASLGRVCEKLGKLPEAIEEYRAVLQLQSDLYDIRLKLADLLEQVNQYAEAADLLENLFYDGQAADINALWSRILRLRGEDSKKAVVQLKRSGQYNLVDLVINKTVPATVIVDTEAQYTIISEKLSQRLNILLSTRTSDVHFDFYGRTFKAPLINLPSIKVGGLEVQNIPTLIWDLSGIPNVDGVLGRSFLKYFQVEMKPDEQLFVLTKLHS